MRKSMLNEQYPAKNIIELNNSNSIKLNNFKGITLIALIITIVVLLILSGVAINSIVGSDSAPAKANEARQKTDIGVARDEVSLLATNAQMEAYEQVYVNGKKTDDSGDDVIASGASTEVSNYVKSKLNEAYGTPKNVGLAKIGALDDGETIIISTTDFAEIGTVSETGGNLTWKQDDRNSAHGVNGVIVSTEPDSEHTNFSTQEGRIDVVFLSGTGRTPTTTPNEPILTAKNSNSVNETMTKVTWTKSR